MRKLLAKIERVRASGWATLDLPKDHPLSKFDGKRFQIESMAIAEIKCRVKLIIEGRTIDFTIDDLC